jgi:hypothetical protein
MNYLMLIYSSEKQESSLSGDAINTIMQEYKEFTQSIVQSGKFKAADRLKPTSSASTVRVRDGKVTTTDGPFAETREQLGGYYLVDAKDLDEAIAIAARIPTARVGSIEVRPIWPIT